MWQIPVPLFYYKEDIKMPTSIADAISKALNELQKQIDELKAQMATRSVTTTTPPTADGTGLPGFVILDTKPETEYQNYVYIYPRD